MPIQYADKIKQGATPYRPDRRATIGRQNKPESVDIVGGPTLVPTSGIDVGYDLWPTASGL